MNRGSAMPRESEIICIISNNIRRSITAQKETEDTPEILVIEMSIKTSTVPETL